MYASHTNQQQSLIRIGCAGWSIPKAVGERFPAEGSQLERYARVLPAVEINSSFYRPHKPATYERWAASVPDTFRFAVKIPKAITHTHKLNDIEPELRTFLDECSCLGTKLGALLVQLPPSLAFDAQVAGSFFALVRGQFDGEVACEPRHSTWFAAEPDSLLASYHVARVAADPAVVPEAAEPGGWDGLVYYRLHGSPRIYYSDYPQEYLQALAKKLSSAAAAGSQVWCIFDNTAEGAATDNALAVMAMIAGNSEA